jgi:exodeoxyribonuclease V alpha subunit
MSAVTPEADGAPSGFDAELALGAPAPLDGFNRAGVLAAADVHVAVTLTSLAGVPLDNPAGELVALATALAVRAPRLGHVFVDLATVAQTVASEATESSEGGLAWPDPVAWRLALVACPELVASDEVTAGALRPLRLLGSRLYLDRYWRQERALAQTLTGLDRQPIIGTELPALADLLARLFPDSGDGGQRSAAACAALRGLTVVAGGPGTGKTPTVARPVVARGELAIAADRPAPLIALCAPPGRAAARLAQAVGAESAGLALSAPAAAALGGVNASTIHRLLGARGEGRFRYTRTNPLPHDIVIVDETSMVSLSLISHLLEAVRSDARVVLVGDPDQLSAIEAGAVLRDIVGPGADGPCFGPGMRSILTRVSGTDPGESISPNDFGNAIVVLRRGHRFGAPIGALAEAIRGGNPEAAVTALRAQRGATDAEITWLEVEGAELGADGIATAALRSVIEDGFAPLIAAARAGDVEGALSALGRLRLLCAHRQGRYGVRSWTLLVEEWLAQSTGLVLEGDYAGRPVLLTENDHELSLYNGDSGVMLSADGSLSAAFEREGGVLAVAPARLGAVQTAFASTIHRSQGSQFETAVVILPDPDSRLLTRELLYTAVTRAQRRLVILGTEEALAAAVSRPVQRATGLRERLWRE